MPVQYMQAITERYQRLGYAPYRWFVAESPAPWQAVAKPLSALRLGLLSTSGCYALGQCAYHYRDDASIREIDSATPVESLRFSHITENYLEDARRDPNCIFPLGTLRRLVQGGLPGALAEKVLSCMGGVYSQRKVREQTAPAVLAALQAQRVDAALLVAM